MEISTLILWGCLVLFVWCCGGFFVRGNHCHTLGCWIKWCSSWCIETQGAVVTSWICHRILGEVRMKNLFCCKCAFCCQCEHGERTKRIRKVSYWAKAKEVWDKYRVTWWSNISEQRGHKDSMLGSEDLQRLNYCLSLWSKGAGQARVYRWKRKDLDVDSKSRAGQPNFKYMEEISMLYLSACLQDIYKKKGGVGKTENMRQWKGRTSPVNNEHSAKLNPRKRKYSHPLFFPYPCSHRISVCIA